MDIKDLRTGPALSEHNNDGSKYTQGGGATLPCNRSKSYQDIGSNPLAKAEGTPVRPCAVIGPDRVLPPPTASDAFLKKGPVEPWPSLDNGYRRPPDYPHRLYENPARNISPRQTFQENMQRINVPPTYNAVRHSDSANFNHIQDRSISISKNAKPNMAPEAKYCDVPYAQNALANEPKNVRDSELYVSSVNSQLTRSAPHVWPPGSLSVNVPRTYSVNEPYQYQQYPSCAGQRPPVVPMTRPHRTMQDDPAYVYPDHYYRDATGRLKPYPQMKERCPQPRYEYVGNYAGQFHPPPPAQPLKYDIPKSSQTHPYPVFPNFKYLDNRVPDPNLEGYQRSTSHQSPYNIPFRAQVIHPTYGQMSSNAPQKVQPYPQDRSVKTIPLNKLHYDNNSSKMYIDYENARTKPYPMADNYYVNEMNRFNPLKNQMVMPSYPPIGMRAMPSQQYYIKDNPPMKPFEYMPTFRNFEPHLTGNPVLRHAPQFSPNTLAISPTDSSTSNEMSQTHSTSQEDCGYVSQSSSTSARSIDSGIYRLPHEYYKRHDFRYGSIVGNSHALAKTDLNFKDSKQKQIDVRQFLQMWNEGEEENNSENNNSKDIIIQTGSSDMGNFPKHANTEDQLYVLGLVNVPTEDLSKYEHIEKISKLPENIKGYNNLELFSRFEEAMESCNTAAFKTIPKEYQNSSKAEEYQNSIKAVSEALQRPVSPLDVESKISQSVIHKDVGCNFEIKPCSPKMLNVEIAAPAQNILGERIIEKVSNPLSKIVKSPLPIKSDDNSNCHTVIRQDNVFAITDNPSCKMIRSPFSSNNMDSVKTNYSLQDLEINSGVCLASLPQLDNEIELNFPEVNQQFINANKKDGVSTANYCPQNNLQVNSSLADNKQDKSDSEKTKIKLTDCDKTFNKLSKYRKSKTSTTDSSENKSKAVRTDSVIIKNPENIENKMLENSLSIPMNLSSQSIQWYNSPHECIENKDNDMALDFSLNKSSNDFPIIETEKDELVKQLQINHSHISPQNANAPCHENICVNEITMNLKTTVESIETVHDNVSCVQNYKDLSHGNILPMVNSKESVALCIQTDFKTAFKVQNNQEGENKPDDTSNKVIKSVILTKDTDSLGSKSTRSDNLVFGNTEFENINDGTEQHVHISDDKKDFSKLHDTCKDIMSEEPEANTDENSMILISNGKINNNKINLKNDFDNFENPIIPHSKIMCNEIENVKQFFSSDEYSEVNKTELLTNSENENDFEHDEISASLEKLFRESNEEISSPKTDNCSSSESISKPYKKNGCHRSKELYSPWIQKLLTHSEGSCNELSQKRITKSIFYPEEQSDKRVQSDIEILKDGLGQDLEISHNESITPKLYFEPNNIVTKKVSKDLTSDTSPSPESNALNQTPDDVPDSMKKIDELFDKGENEPENKKSKAPVIEEHDILYVNKSHIGKASHQLINDKKKQHSDVGVDTSKRKIKKRKLHNSMLPTNLSNCDNEYSSNKKVNSKIYTYACKNSMTENESETIKNRKSSCELDSIIQKDLTAASSKNVSDLVSDDEKEQTEDIGCKKVLSENIMTNYNSDIDLAPRILNSNKTDFKLDDMVQDDFNETSIKNVSNDVSYSITLTEHQISENSRRENVIESVFEDRNKATGEISMNFVSCTEDSAVLKKQSNLTSETLTNSVSGIYTERQEQEPLEEGVITNMTIKDSADIMDDKMETRDSNKIVQDVQNVSGKCNSVCDNCTTYRTEESKILEHLEYGTKDCDKDTDKTSGLINIVSKKVLKNADVIDFPKILTNRLEVNNCISYQAKENKFEEGLVKTRNSKEEEFVNDDVVSQENQYSCSSTSSVSNNDIEYQKKENPNEGSLIDNVTDIQYSDIHQISEATDSFEVDCTDKNIIKEDPKICSDSDSENLSEKDSLEKTFTDVEKYKDHDVISDTLSKVNAVCKEDDFQEDQRNITSEILSSSDSDNSIGYKIPEYEMRENINQYASEGLAEAESNVILSNIQAKNTNHETRHHFDNLSKNSKAYINRDETQKNEILNCLLANKDIEKEETEECVSTKNVELDYVTSNEQCSNSNAGDHLINDNKHETEDEIKEENYSQNQPVLKDGDIRTDIISSEVYDNRTNIEPVEENTSTNLSDCVTEQWLEDYNEKTISNKVTITTTDDEYGCCEDNKDSVVVNNLTEVEHHSSNKHHQFTSTQESPIKQRLTLKRSLSDSALNIIKNRETPDRQLIDNTPMWPPKRPKMNEIDSSEQQAINENFCNFMQNRRNSISAYYNAKNVSFCILIDNDCILTDENEEEKICFAEVSEDCITEINTADVEDNASEVICGPEENEIDYSDTVMLSYDGEKSIQESWLDDVACVETVVSDDIIEDADNDAPVYSRDVEVSNYDESGIFNSDINELTHGVDFINDEDGHDISEFKNTYRTPRDDDKIVLYDEELQYPNNYVLYSGQCMEKILSESYRTRCSPSPTSDYSESILLPDGPTSPKLPEDKENVFVQNITMQHFENDSDRNSENRDTEENNVCEVIDKTTSTCSIQHDNTIVLPESSINNILSYKKDDSYSASSSSPEVSSTTFDEKSSSILLKITNYNGSRISQINEVNHNRPRCKFTESKDYSNSQGSFPKRPLITKAAQKYIPPLKESIRDLKVKLPLPQQRLLKLKQLKLSRREPKVVKQNISTISKKQKPKPNFEDVLKNIDEVQIKMHKQNSKKNKNTVPKVVIKKNLNGSHYTSSSSKEKFNPDLTGRKWQPWVFLERNRFIDNMAMTNKTKAIFSHRKNTYVLSEKFKKYKSVNNCSGKFVISQPKTNGSSKGQLKYTIRLKHS